MNVLITETNAGSISFFAPSSDEEWSAQHDTRDEFLLATEQSFISQGVVTHGLIDEADIPPVPDGGLASDMYWDDDLGALAYGNTQLKVNLLNQRDNLLDASSADLLLSIENYHHDSSYDYRLIVQNPFFSACRTYRDALRDLDASIEADPYAVVFPTLQPVIAQPSLDDYKQNKLNELQKAFNDEQVSGVTSAALGADHQYDMDQHNIAWITAAAALTAHSTYTGNPVIKCDDLQGNVESKVPRGHTAEQCKDLLLHCMVVIWNMKSKLDGLKNNVEDAADEAAVDAIIWGEAAVDSVGW